jgi:hypothetical protein
MSDTNVHHVSLFHICGIIVIKQGAYAPKKARGLCALCLPAIQFVEDYPAQLGVSRKFNDRLIIDGTNDSLYTLFTTRPVAGQA